MEEIKKTLADYEQDVARKNIRLGIKIAAVMNSYYWGELISYLKGENNPGGMYLCELKPLYDEYGYTLVNKTLLEIDKEYSTNE